ncbi:hypothetical protein [Ferroacidibacillus organovorans]|uniref:Uncharacterized protein n=1 Tax=Ferroacidibacillus organovorans TaxID=1765683 RepID=A0A853KCQ3_9BACL|nr:hypothetical protein [Ferroacidibacillus organovorans]KYP81910.1 hypothetical protein AYJ22_05130 [Ferroacidibacillus organovorans]OAG94885.1 hypothetical protein AYW79_02485 [Ferroacidibacillus organovorans]
MNTAFALWVAADGVLLVCLWIQHQVMAVSAFQRSAIISGFFFLVSMIGLLAMPARSGIAIAVVFQSLGWIFTFAITLRALKQRRKGSGSSVKTGKGLNR